MSLSFRQLMERSFETISEDEAEFFRFLESFGTNITVITEYDRLVIDLDVPLLQAHLNFEISRHVLYDYRQDNRLEEFKAHIKRSITHDLALHLVEIAENQGTNSILHHRAVPVHYAPVRIELPDWGDSGLDLANRPKPTRPEPATQQRTVECQTSEHETGNSCIRKIRVTPLGND